jgi:hypothetical protein
MLLSLARILLSVIAGAAAAWLYRFFKEGLIARSWPIFALAAAVQALGGLGAIIHTLFQSEAAGVFEGVADVVSVLGFLLFTLKLRKDLKSWPND